MNNEFIISILNRMKKEVDKRNYIREHGVDLANYENEFYNTTMDLLLEYLGHKYKTDIEWWLFEDTATEILINGETYNIKDARDFFNKVIFEDPDYKNKGRF